jgi:sugar lactone lactonase YvrE
METLTPSVLLEGLVFPECPRWHEGKLWFSDMHAYKVQTVDLNGRLETIASVAERPAGLGFLPDGQLIVVSMRDRRLLRLEADGLREIADLSDLANGNLNDMVVDAEGRAYIGNFGYDYDSDPMSLRPTNIVLVTPDGQARSVADGLIFPNGTVISPDGGTLIVAETFAGRLTAFTVASDGSLADRRLFAELGGPFPDGICLDADGAVWVGSPSTSEFLRVLEGGQVTHRVPVPGKWAVACMLGGDDRRTLFLCTAETTPQDLAKGKSKGWIEALRVDVPGAGRP